MSCTRKFAVALKQDEIHTMKNKTIYFIRYLIVLTTTLGFLQFTTAQEKELNTTISNVTLFGTSNIHDWEMIAETMSGKALFVMENNVLKGIEKLEFVVNAESLKSGKKAMDNNTYKALNTSIHKNITYELNSCTSLKAISDNVYEIVTQGQLTIAGVTKEVPLTFNVKLDGKKVTLSGEMNLTMTTYNVEPPKALLGTIKTGDALTIKFKATYN